MNYSTARLLFVLPVLLFTSCTGGENRETQTRLSHDITSADIKTHVEFLADDKLRGREAGSAGEARAANYIADYFRQFGLEPAGDSSTYFQEFILNTARLSLPNRPDTTTQSAQKRIARNVIGLLRGTAQPEKYIIIGAHYDHLGMGSFGSLNNNAGSTIHNGADDNASGTAGLLELAQYFSRHPTDRSLLFIGFSGEEMGLLGSQHFVDNPTVSLEQTVAMINMDMIGRMKDNRLLIYGTGSSSGWESLIEQAGTETLSISTIPDGTGASDHTSFYNKNIPVLHYFTDTHADYHRPSDDSDYINYQGESSILDHIRRLVSALDALPDDQLAFQEAPANPHRGMTLNGVTLGVTPDYSFEGSGMRITGVRSSGPAGRAGLQSGDVIIKLDNQPLQDIYEYMEVLNKLEKGDKSTVTVLRGGKQLTLDLTF